MKQEIFLKFIRKIHKIYILVCFVQQSYIHELISYIEADIDWDYMDVYVRAMGKKQVIADVVDYKNEVIARTKELVEK